MRFDDWACAIYMGLVAVVVSCGAVGSCIQSHYRTEAVKHGAATWEVKDDGSTTFKWKGTP